MKISYNWLREYLPTTQSETEIATLLTNVGIEIEGIESTAVASDKLKDLIVGEVQKVTKHENSDRLKVTSIYTGNGSNLQIVCGANNVAIGQKVVIAPVGATLHPITGESFKIKKAKLRGVESQGMICAEDEIGIGNDHDGILVLPDDYEPGKSLVTYLENQNVDFIFDVSLTPNRADAYSHIGIARDLKVALQLHKQEKVDLIIPDVDFFKPDINNCSVTIEIDDPKACPRYAGLTITGIEVKESPDWLKKKLTSIGLTPKNNIVDITNFVMFETGQPLHPFDLEQITGNTIRVKTAKKDESFITLDGQERTLRDEDLVICNVDHPMCMAGVYGGLNSGVVDSTTNIFIESAYFNPSYIRKTVTHHQLKTDAAMRFEKGADVNQVIYALKRAALLIKELAGGQVSAIEEVYPRQINKAQISFAPDQINSFLGLSLTHEELRNILELQGIEISDTVATIPTHKVDVTREVDLMEEVIRFIGFDAVPILPQFTYEFSSNKALQTQKKQHAYTLLTGIGLTEIMSNSIIHNKYKSHDSQVQLENSAAKGFDLLRKDLLISGLEVVAHNLNHNNKNLRFFEFGKGYQINENGGYTEKSLLSILLSGNVYDENWLASTTPYDFYHLKGIINALAKRLGVLDILFQESQHPDLDNSADILHSSKKIGHLGTINKKLAKTLGIKQTVWAAELDWSKWVNLDTTTLSVNDISKYPTMRRDLALLIDSHVTFQEIKEVCIKRGGTILKEINLFDVFEDDKLGKNKKSYAVSFTFSDRSKTLTDKEVDAVMKKIIQSLEQSLQAQIR